MLTSIFYNWVNNKRLVMHQAVFILILGLSRHTTSLPSVLVVSRSIKHKPQYTLDEPLDANSSCKTDGNEQNAYTEQQNLSFLLQRKIDLETQFIMGNRAESTAGRTCRLYSCLATIATPMDVLALLSSNTSRKRWPRQQHRTVVRHNCITWLEFTRV